MADKPFPEGNDVVVSKGPCPNCPTERGNVTYEDGHAHCFSCGHKTPAGGGATASPPRAPRPPSGQLLSRDGSAPDPSLSKRNLSAKTLARYGYFLAGFKGQTVHVAPYYDQQGELVAQKVRFPNKEFTVLYAGEGAAKITQCRLFGHQVYGDKFDRRVVITEGEIDAMSVAQEMDFKCAAVSVNGGSKSAVACLKANYLWLDRFQEIILWFDDDEPGREATEQCAKLFAVGKVRVAKVQGCKDASDVLQRGTPGDIQPAVFAATAWRPEGIVNAADNESDVLAPVEGATDSWSYTWPWHEANEMLGPMLPGQVIYHVAGTGIGKTTAIAELEMHLKGQGCKLGILSFEDIRRDVKLRLLGIAFSDRFDIRPRPDDEMLVMHRKVFGDRLIELFDPETAEWTVEAILGYVRYLAKGLDCKVLVVDPLTFIAAGMAPGDDQVRALDRVSRDLAAMAKELAICIHVVHHLTDPRDGVGHTEGAATSINQVRGSGGIANFASIVIGYERDQQAEGGLEMLTQLRSLKNRPRSKTGPILTMRYDMGTGRLKATTETFPGPHGKGNKGFNPRGKFPPPNPNADHADY